jgi:hypothetical protein
MRRISIHTTSFNFPLTQPRSIFHLTARSLTTGDTSISICGVEVNPHHTRLLGGGLMSNRTLPFTAERVTVRRSGVTYVFPELEEEAGDESSVAGAGTEEPVNGRPGIEGSVQRAVAARVILTQPLYARVSSTLASPSFVRFLSIGRLIMGARLPTSTLFTSRPSSHEGRVFARRPIFLLIRFFIASSKKDVR